MIDDKKFIEKQINRLAQLDKFPRESEARKELGMALALFATEQQAKAFIDGIAGYEGACPFPASIRKAACEAQERENTSWLEAKQCPDCGGSGFRMEAKIMRASPGMNPARYEFAVKCDHRGTRKPLASFAGDQANSGVA